MQREDTPLCRLTFYSEMTTHQLGQTLGNGKTQPRTAVFSGGRGICLRKAFKDLLQLFLADTDTRIFYFNTQPDKGLAFVLEDLATLLDRNKDLPLAGELNGITQQVDDNLTDTYRVTQ